MNPITEPMYAGEYVLSEGPRGRSRDTVTIAQNQTLLAGTVLGQVSDGAATAVAGGGNTGNGVFGAITNSAGAPAGAYVATCVQATTAAADTIQAHEGNVGTGAIGSVTIGALAELGAYRVELTATGATAAFDVFTPQGTLLGSGHVGTPFSVGGVAFTLSNAGTMTAGDAWDIIVTDDGAALFSLTDPNGKVLANITVGAAYTGELNFTLSQGVTKFVVGDTFTITVAAGSGQYVKFNPSAVDGSQNAAAINFAPITTGSGVTVPAVAHTRDIEAKAGVLDWGSCSGPQIAAGIAQLAKHGIIVR